MYYLIFNLLFTVNVFAKTPSKIGKKPKREKVEKVTKVVKNSKKGHFSTGLKKSFCMKGLPTDEDIKKLLDGKTLNSILGNETVHGVVLTDESTVLIDAFKMLTTAMNTFGSREELENQKDIQETYKINPECNKVECAVKKIWGESMGPKMLYVLLHHGYNTSELAFDNSSRFSADELDDVILALGDLPEDLSSLGKTNQRLTHFTRGHLPPFMDRGAIANAVIMLFDVWSNEARDSRRYFLYHELSHNVGAKINAVDKSTEWLSKSGWSESENFEWSRSGKSCFASPYAGRVDGGEDWAESVAVFRYNLNNFKERCPDKYNFIKEVVYKNREFTSAESCAENSIEQNGQIEEIELMSPESLDD